MQRFRLAEDRLPDSLEQVVPRFLDELPTDPYTGGLLRYTRLETGFTVYSLGDDEKDDGGPRDDVHNRKRKPGEDIGFTIRW